MLAAIQMGTSVHDYRVTPIYGGTAYFDLVSKVYTVTTAISTPDLNDLIANAKDGSIIRFDEGVFHVTEAVKVLRGDLTLQGAGEGKTVFETAFSKPQSTFYFSGEWGEMTTARDNIVKGATAVTVEDSSLFKVGDEIRVFQSNDLDFIRQQLPADIANDPYMNAGTLKKMLESGSLYGNVEKQYYMAHNPLREVLTEIERIEGNTVYLKNAVGFNMAGGTAIVQKLLPLDNLSVSGFTVQTDLPVANPGTMTNAENAWKGTNALGFFLTRGTDVHDITILNPGSMGLTAYKMYDANINGITVIGAVNKGDGANGYGINIAGTQYSNFTDLKIFDTRHAVVFSSWGTETGNTVHVTETNRDINFHGGPDSGNIITVDKAVLNYYDAIPPSFGVVETFGPQHPYTDVRSNTLAFSYAVGGRAIDVIQGGDFGSYLRGGDAADILIGGRGNDVLIGDAGTDRMTGGAGADIFVMTNEITPGWAGSDVITDFNAAEGDKLLFIISGRTILESDVKFTARGADSLVSIKGLDMSVLLKGVALGQIGLGDVILNTKPYSENPLDYIHTIRTDKFAPVDPDMDFRASNGFEHHIGGNGNDVVTGWGSAFYGDVYEMKSGMDTLVFTARDAWVKSDTLPTMSGVDVIDLSPSTTISRVHITNEMIAQSDNRVLVIKNDDTVINQLHAVITDKDLRLLIDSRGDVHLGDKSSNVVYLHENNASAIHGGSGNDKIHLSHHQDIVSGGAGKDIFVLYANTDGKPDIIRDFNAKDDKLDISNLLFGYDPLQSAIDDFLHVNVTADGKTHVQIDRDGTGTAFGMETAVVFDTKVDMTGQELLNHNNLIVT